MADFEDLTRRVLELLSDRAAERALPQIGSRTLRAALEVIVNVPGAEARLHIPHYWAVYYHDGRGSFGPKEASVLVFFARPEDDPRLVGGVSPERASHLRRLTRDEFYRGLEINTRNRQLGLPPFMFVLRDVGPAGPHPFFDNDGGMRGFADEMSRGDGEGAALLDQFMQRLVDEEINEPGTDDTAEFGISFDI